MTRSPFDPSKLEPMPVHVQMFIKTYADRLKEEFDKFTTAINLMRSSDFTITCPARAAALADQLHELQVDFMANVTDIAMNRNMRERKNMPPHPHPLELLHFVQTSFFKLVKSDDDGEHIVDCGWNSGHPFNWEDAEAEAKIVAEVSAPVSALLSAIQQLFSMGQAKQLERDDDEDYEDDDDDSPEYFDQQDDDKD